MTWAPVLHMNTLVHAHLVSHSEALICKIWGVCQEMFVKRYVILCYIWLILALESQNLCANVCGVYSMYMQAVSGLLS